MESRSHHHLKSQISNLKPICIHPMDMGLTGCCVNANVSMVMLAPGLRCIMPTAERGLHDDSRSSSTRAMSMKMPTCAAPSLTIRETLMTCRMGVPYGFHFPLLPRRRLLVSRWPDMH